MNATARWTAESPVTYLPVDRLHALAKGATLRDRAQGAALFADVSGFTTLTATLARDLGPRRGSEEITRLLNSVFDAITDEIHRYGGSVISFGGDAITCWFDGDSGLRAVAAALAVQQAMAPFASLHLAIKVSVVAGPVRRLAVGDPQQHMIDVLAGATLDRLSCVEKRATAGEVVLDQATANALVGGIAISAWRTDAVTGERFAVVAGLTAPVAGTSWLELDKTRLAEDRLRPWLVPEVYARLRSSRGEFLAELRPVVVLFAHFTGIDYDADDQAGEKLDTFVRRAQTILADHGGTLLQLMFGDKGSTLYAAFGALVAHEDDAERGAAAALKLAALPASLGFISCIRIGVSQGVAHAGAYGGKTRRTFGVLGDAVNLSARLMQAAAPGQILASQEVYQTLADTFNWQPLPDLQLKGKHEPVTAYALLAERSQRRRTMVGLELALPLIGRQRELALIEARLDLAGQGRGQIVGIIAEAGLGKSRLAVEVVQQADRRGWRCYTGECSASDIYASYYAWHPIWQQFFGIDPSWHPTAQTQALEAQLELFNPNLTPRLPLVGAAIGLPLADNELTASFDARLRRSSLEALLVDCLRARSRHGPLLLLLEDCHWLDPLSHDLLDTIAHAIVDLPVMILMTYRPPQLEHLREPRVTSLPHFVGIDLEAFSSEETQRLIELKLARTYGMDDATPARLAENIAQRAEGNPFFVEALVDFVATREIDVEDTEALAKLDLPSSLQSLILSRIDRLAESQRITLKVASIIGRVFDLPVLWGYYPQVGEESEVLRNMETLSVARLTEPIADDSLLTFAFRHALIQEVVYESLPFAKRAVLHEQMGQFIEHTWAHQLDQHLNQLAFHYCASHNEAKKREYLLKAGRHAQQVYANSAAIDYFQRLLPLLAVAEKPEVLLDLGRVLELVGRWREALDSYVQARDLAETTGQAGHAAAAAQCALGDLARKQGDYSAAATWLAQARSGYEAQDDQAGVAQTLHYLGTLLARQGNYAGARQAYGESLTIRRALGDQRNTASLLGNLAIVARFESELAAARQLDLESLHIREALGDRWAIGVSLNNLGLLALKEGNYAEAQSQLDLALAIWREVGDPWAAANTLVELGNLARERARYAEAAALYGESLAINRELNDKVTIAYLFEDIGCLAALQGAPRRALRLVAAAARLRETIGAPLAPAEASRLQERLAGARQQLSEPDQLLAETAGLALSFDQAIELATHWTES